jgi:hypothetical protein
MYCLDQAGDMNEDGLVNSLDIDAFTLALQNLSAWQDLHPKLNVRAAGDINLDGLFSNLDIDAFATLLHFLNSLTTHAANRSSRS